MQLKSLARWTCALLAVAGAPAMAQQASIEDLAKNPDLSDVALSPTGEYVALAVPAVDNSETLLQIVRIDGKTPPKTFRFAKDSHVGDLVWTADDQVTVARKLKRPLSHVMLETGELMSTDLTGEKQRTLFAYVPDDGTKRGRNKDEGWAYLKRVLDDEPGKALVSFTCWNCGEDPDAVIFKVDTRTGTRQEVERIKGTGEGVGLFFDHAGVARIASSVNPDGTPDNKYRPTPASAWTPLPKAIAGFDIDGGVFAEDNNTFYGLVSDHGEANQLYKIDLAAGTRTRMYGDADVDVANIMLAGRKGIPFGIEYNTYKPKIQYFDNNSPWAQLHAALMKKFPGQLISFLDFTRDDSKILFAAQSDKVAGNYYVIDRANGNAITQVGSRTPWLDGKKFASKKPIEFKNREGQTIYGYYTAPLGASAGTPKPLVVMPHGGPYGERDEWTFDNDVQFLASRGYGVLQVNYRGSGGRGNDFVVNAWKQWGGIIQNDITDGVKFAIDAKLADSSKICIYGASFGGYSAMMQPILNPGMYKCAIGYVGVYDLPLHSRSKETLTETGEVWLGRTLGTDMDALAKISPANRASEIKVPVMLVHGKADSNVGMNQFRAMENALTNIGQAPETFLAAGEGHGFNKPENRAELYRRMETFLDKYIGPGSQSAASQ